MACETLIQQTVRFSVTAGQLPEGFCPSTIQDMFNAMVARIIVSPNQSFSSFAIGPNPPPNNQGPWLKDCLTWFVFDDASATYIPINKGGFDKEEFHSTSGTFIVPDFIYKLKVSVWGGGGGGQDIDGTNPGGGGGGGAFVKKILTVTPAQAIPFTVGAAGVNGAPGTNGGTSTFLTLSAGGGVGASTVNGGVGGTAAGGTMNYNGGPGSYGIQGDPGNGGDSPQGGQGGVPRTTNISIPGVFPGGGGNGGYPNQNATSGAGGAILIEW